MPTDEQPIGNRRVLDCVKLRDVRNFGAWLGDWRARWLAGERVSVLVALDRSHAIVVEDPNATRPPKVRVHGEELRLF